MCVCVCVCVCAVYLSGDAPLACALSLSTKSKKPSLSFRAVCSLEISLSLDNEFSHTGYKQRVRYVADTTKSNLFLLTEVRNHDSGLSTADTDCPEKYGG